MALSATIYKIDCQISDLDRHYYQNHSLTIALHPSETALRMMVRVLAFALNASDELEFTKGLSDDEAPDLWRKTLTGEIDLRIDVGQPTLKRVKKACNQSNTVKIYTYSGHSAEVWWKQNQADFEKLKNLQIIDLPARAIAPLSDLIERNMALQCTIQDGLIWFGNAQLSCEITPEALL